MKVTEVLSPAEIQALNQPSDFRGFLAVATTWGMISGAFAIVALWPSVFTVLLAGMILGGRHLALAILMHDASHYSLFRTRRLNDVVGAWFCGYPTWQDLGRYRKHHLRHHQFAGSDADPDVSLIRGFPTSRASLARKLLRDIVGITGLRRIVGLLLMDFGFIEYTVASDTKPIPQAARSPSDVVLTGFRNLHGVFLTNVALFAVLFLVGHPALYLLWAGSYLTFFSLFVRIRSIAEHACTEAKLDPWRNTRTTDASPFARVTVAPHRVNFHLEHHLLMTLPYFNLPKFHALLAEKDALKYGITAKNYVEVLRTAVRP